MHLRTLATAFTTLDAPATLAKNAGHLASHHDAHVTGICVTADSKYYPAMDNFLTAETVAEINRKQQKKADEAKTAFAAATGANNVRSDWRVVWSALKTVAEAISDSGRAADLLMIARPENYVYQMDDVHAQVVRSLGRPVLLVPEDASLEGLHKHALIGWSETREASRAAFDALLLLDEGSEITLLNVGARGKHELADGPMNDLAAALSRHGMSVNIIHREPGTDSAAIVIQREAQEIGASFIATGAFGHSRAYDFVIGAVTRQLMSECTLPTMFSK